MKSLAIFILFSLAFWFSASAMAQTWSDSTVKVLPTVFPIGGFHFGDLGDSINNVKALNLNTVYNAKGGGEGSITKVTHGLIATTGSDNIAERYFGTRFGSGATETRFFMAWNYSDPSYEFEATHNWVNSVGTSTNNEWFIAFNKDIIGKPNYVLDSLAVDPSNIASEASFTISPESDSAWIDFFYRIDSLGSFPISTSTSLFTLELTIFDVTGTAHSFSDNITIAGYYTCLADTAYWNNEHPNMRLFPNGDLTNVFPKPTPHSYARIRHAVPMIFGGNGVRRIECKLRTHKLWDIYVRGLRIRSHKAEDILTGKKNIEIDSVLDGIRSLFSTPNWAKVRNICSGGEMTGPSARSWAYVCDRARHRPNVLRDIIPFIAENTSNSRFKWIRFIYEDQNGELPPLLEAEQFEPFYRQNVGWTTFDTTNTVMYPRDCLAPSLRNRSDFITFEYLVAQPTPYDYSHYTRTIQHGFRTIPFNDMAAEAYPPGRTPAKWEGLVNSLYSVFQDKLSFALRNWNDTALLSLAHDILLDIRDTVHNPVYKYDRLLIPHNIYQTLRSPIRSEMRTNMWQALAYGAKGIHWNTMTTDGGEDNGLVLNNEWRVPKDFDSTSPCFEVQGGIVIPDSLYDGYLITNGSIYKTIGLTDPMPPGFSHKVIGSNVKCFLTVFPTTNTGETNPYGKWGCGWASNCPKWGADILRLWAPMFYGHKERWEGALRAGQDLLPVAPKLSQLNWKGAVKYHHLFNQPPRTWNDEEKVWRAQDSLIAVSNWNKGFVKSVKSFAVNQFAFPLAATSTQDADSLCYTQLGFFSSSESQDSSADFLVVNNMRSWPMYIDSVAHVAHIDTTNGKLGAIDGRLLAITFDKDKLHETSFPLLRVTNLRTNRDTIIHRDSSYAIILEPGEGTLLKIAPAVTLTLGTMDENIYNNSRHISTIEGDTIDKKYVATYPHDGNIYVAYPVETPSGLSKRTADPVHPDSLIVDDIDPAYYPAVAYGADKRIGLVYQITRPTGNPLFDSIEVWYRVASTTSKYTFATSVMLDGFTTTAGFIAAPAIAAAQDTTYHFWAGWTTRDKGIKVTLIGHSTNLTTVKTPLLITAGDSAYTKFVSLATHKDAGDSVYIGFQEHTDIYYTTGILPPFPAAPVLQHKPIIRLTKNCGNRHPQIAVTKNKTVGIVYEHTGYEYLYTKKPFNFHTEKRNYVCFRERNAVNFKWRGKSFLAMKAPPAVWTNFDSLYSLPNIAMASKAQAGATSAKPWKDSVRITFNNVVDNVVGIVRSDKDSIAGWTSYNMIEPSLEPAMPIVCKQDSVVQPLMFRAPATDDMGQNVRITQYDFPVTNVTPTTNKVVRFTTGVTSALCTNLIGAVRKVTIKPNGGDPTIANIDIGVGAVAPIAPEDFSAGWSDKRLRSDNLSLFQDDTISYDRFFRVGEFNAGDTTDLSGYLTDSSDYIKIRFLLRQNATDAIVAVLDSCILTKTGFYQTGNVIFDSGYKEYVMPSTPVGLTYLTFEVDRGDSANAFELEQETAYGGDSPVDVWPPPEPLEKRSEPSPKMNGISTHSISVSVVPNPFHLFTTVTADVIKNVFLNISLFDLLGRKMMELANTTSADQSHYEFTLGNERLSNGVYLLRVQSGNQVETRKVELQK
jgi:hypothetical protein